MFGKLFAKVKKGVQTFMQSSVDLEELAQNAESAGNNATGKSSMMPTESSTKQYRPIENQEVKVHQY